jgi:hypothetical protein
MQFKTVKIGFMVHRSFSWQIIKYDSLIEIRVLNVVNVLGMLVCVLEGAKVDKNRRKFFLKIIWMCPMWSCRTYC